MKTFELERVISEIKREANSDNLGMLLVHNGVVRGTSKNGKKVNGMVLDYDEKKLKELLERVSKLEFVERCVIWLNRGALSVGDDIMYVVLAGNDRKRLLPLFEEIVETLKTGVVKEAEQ